MGLTVPPSKSAAQHNVSNQISDLTRKVESWVESQQVYDPFKEVDRLAKVIKLPDLRIDQNDRFVGEYYFKKHPLQSHHWVVITARALADALLAFMEVVVTVFGINSLFVQSEDPWEEERKSHKLMTLIHFVPTLSGTVLPLIGIEDASKSVALVLSILMTISVIYPRLRPTPRRLPRGVNWTNDLDKMVIYEGKKEHLEKAAVTLKQKKKVLLVGASGVGKTATVKAFTQAIANGDYPELTGKTVYYFNTANIFAKHGMGSVLSTINEKVGDKRDNIIFVFDEFHTACKDKQMAEQFKTLLDPGPHGFPYVIAVTTDDEFKEYLLKEQGPLVRRFEVLHKLRPSKEELTKILLDILIQEMPEALIEPGVLEEMIKQGDTISEEPYQVHHAVEILRKCMDKISDTQFDVANPEKIQAQDQVDALSAQSFFQKIDQDITSQANAIRNINIAQQQNTPERKRFFEMRKMLLEAKITMYKIALKAEPSQTELTKYYLLKHHLYPTMEHALRSRADNLEIKTVIDTSLVQEVIKTSFTKSEKN